MQTVDRIPAFSDNYIWSIVSSDGDTCVIVDPGDDGPVIEYIAEHGLHLAAIIITHHHPDHIGGVKHLVEKFSCPVYGPETISVCDHPVADDDEVTIASADLTFKVIACPGHTLDHIAYYGHGALFCGDTIFSGGCGRLFEGTPAQMHESISRLATLPADTKIYCAHEYTEANLAFANEVEPSNAELQNYTTKVLELRQQDIPTVPTSMGVELAINPFLRSDSAAIKANLEQRTGESLSSDTKVFAAVRAWKDDF